MMQHGGIGEENGMRRALAILAASVALLTGAEAAAQPYGPPPDQWGGPPPGPGPYGPPPQRDYGPPPRYWDRGEDVWRQHVDYCFRKHPDYDPRTNSYPKHGRWRICQ
jgi:hypothetical protein